MKWTFALAFALLVAGAVPANSQSPATPVDLELVLAVDVSSSVDIEEFTLQMQGIAAAFRSPDVHDAIEIAGERGIAVALVQWSDWKSQQLSIPWHLIDSAESANAFADEIASTPRFGIGGSTAIAGAIQFGVRMIESNEYSAPRRTIDISGDGPVNQGADPTVLRDETIARGITVNGLAILNDHPQLDIYYERRIIGGNAAFVITANDYSDFARAILNKLIREIGGPPIAGAPLRRTVQTATIPR